MRQATVGGLRVSYDDLGTGEPALLFMPGWCGNRTVFRDLVSLCGANRRVLALDWRGHGQSEPSTGDFGERDLVEDALAVIEASGAQRVVPVAAAHAGWVAIELRRRLERRVTGLILLDWIVLDAPQAFLDALRDMQSPERSRQTVERIFSLWLHGVEHPEMERFVRQEMGAYSDAMWARAAREISAAYARAGSPLRALASLEPPVPVLHLYAQPGDPDYLAAQQSFAAGHPWFSVHKLNARSHFPMFEVPGEMAAAIEGFVSTGP